MELKRKVHFRGVELLIFVGRKDKCGDMILQKQHVNQNHSKQAFVRKEFGLASLKKQNYVISGLFCGAFGGWVFFGGCPPFLFLSILKLVCPFCQMH